MAWTVQTDDTGKIKVDETGKPLYSDENGKVEAFDMDQAMNKIAVVNGEAAKNRKMFEDSQASLADFAGISASEAKASIQAAKDFEAEKAKGKGDDARVVAMEAKMEAMAKQLEDSAQQNLAQGKTNMFANSAYIREDTMLDGDVAEKIYGDRFTYDEKGVLTPTEKDGKLMLSKDDYGQPADFNEAISRMMLEDTVGKSFIKTAGGGSASAGNTTITEDQVDWTTLDKNPEALAAMIAKLGKDVVQQRAAAAILAKSRQ